MSDGKARIVYDAVIEHGGTIRPAHYAETMSRLEKWHGRHVTVTVERFVKSKSNPQLRYYFGPLLNLWSEHTGYEHDEMDVELRKAYFPKRREFARITGELVEYIPSLSKATSEEMSTYLDRCIKEGNLLGITFPDPKERMSA